MLRGKCSKYKGLTQTYYTELTGLWPAIEINQLDLDNDSCLNGWGFGNIASSAKDASQFFWELFGTENLLNSEYQALMQSDFEVQSSGWKFNYSLGLMPLCFKAKEGTPSNINETCIIGHGGADWGSHTMLAGFSNAYKYGITVAVNSDAGMNCNLKGNDFFKNWRDEDDPDCLIMDLTNQFFSNGTSPRLLC